LCSYTDIPIKFRDGSKIYSIHIIQDDGNSYNFTRFPKNEYLVCVGELCDDDSYLSKSFRINPANEKFYFTGKAIDEVVDMPVTFGTKHGDVYYQVLMPDLNNKLHLFWLSISEFNKYTMDIEDFEKIQPIVEQSYKFQCVNQNAHYVGKYYLWQMFSYGMKEPLEW